MENTGGALRIRLPEQVKEVSGIQGEENLSTPTRRTTRTRTKPIKYGDFTEVTPTKRKMYQVFSSDEEMDNDFDQPKPTALFTNEDVEGQDMFHFKSRHRKLDLQDKVKEAISNSPKFLDSPKTPRKPILGQTQKKSSSIASEATPKQVKNLIKKRIIQEIESDCGSDFSGSSSDFVPDEKDESDTSSESGNDGSGSENEQESNKPLKKAQVVRGKYGRTRQKDNEYIITPDNYFMMHSSKKITTSDHTLARLKNLNFNENSVEDIEISTEHKNKILELNQAYQHLFDRWLYVLSENFNIILYGVGSKRAILHQFQSMKLKDFPCIVVNGFFPSLTMKSILEAIIVDLLENTHVPSNVGDVVSLIDNQLTELGVDLFLIVHNIDGTMLRNSKAQTMLANLSQIKNVHTIATIDHINAPLLWDHAKLSKLRFTWWDATSWLPYSEETAFETSLLSHRGAALQISSLQSVFRSLTSNAKGIFKIIIEHQIENQKQAHYLGLPFKDLYSKCREQFLVSSDLALRAQLTEFLDHKLVRMKRSYDGGENLLIPIDNVLLQQFLEEQNS